MIKVKTSALKSFAINLEKGQKDTMDRIIEDIKKNNPLLYTQTLANALYAARGISKDKDTQLKISTSIVNSALFTYRLLSIQEELDELES